MAQIKMIEMGITKKDAYVWYYNDLTHNPLILGTTDEDNQTLKLSVELFQLRRML
jgi:hypothetical protein